VTIALDASGQDITNQPPAPVGLRAFATAGGTIRVEWTSPPTSTAKTPTSFLVYFGTNGAPDYSSPVATILYSTSIANAFTYNSATLTSNVTYTIGVRAANATATETNTNTVTVTADASGPIIDACEDRMTTFHKKGVQPCLEYRALDIALPVRTSRKEKHGHASLNHCFSLGLPISEIFRWPRSLIVRPAKKVPRNRHDRLEFTRGFGPFLFSLAPQSWFICRASGSESG
jgi:hypothetical protein